MYELTEIMRQKDDKAYAEILNRLREGNQTDADIQQLKTWLVEPLNPQYPYDAQHMFRTNAEVKAFNETIFVRADTEKDCVQFVSAVVGDVTDAIKVQTEPSPCQPDGRSESDIKATGRWRGSAFLNYIKPTHYRLCK